LQAGDQAAVCAAEKLGSGVIAYLGAGIKEGNRGICIRAFADCPNDGVQAGRGQTHEDAAAKGPQLQTLHRLTSVTEGRCWDRQVY
jgi:hypothetical protein